MSVSDLNRPDLSCNLKLEPVAEMSSLRADETEFLFSIVTLPNREVVGQGKSLHDPRIVELCSTLKEKGIAFTVRPILFATDLDTANDLDSGIHSAPDGEADLGGLMQHDRNSIEDGSLYSDIRRKHHS